MSEEFMKLELRRPSNMETFLLKKLMKIGGIIVNDISNLMVSDLDDGQMGSLLLFVNGKYEERDASKFISEYQFYDEDGVPVIASLYSDKSGVISELDIWKVDFTSLIKKSNDL